jgi:phosphatidylinositol alpha 1,6-mannosyltransferase
MRIVHVTDSSLPRLGGMELQVAGTASRQCAAGHDVSVLSATPGAAGPARIALADGAGGVQAGPRTVRCRGGRRGALDARSRWLLADADVAHVHLGGLSPLAWSALRERSARGEPLVVTVHGRLDPWLLRCAVAAVGGWRGRRGRHVVWAAAGPRIAARLHDLLGPGATVHVVPDAVEPGLWARPSGAAGAPAERVPAERVIVAALRHSRRKRVTALPLILDEARRHVLAHAAATGEPAPRLHAVIAGDGPRTAALHRDLLLRGMAGWVDVPGRLSQARLRDLYHRADVFVAPAVDEPSGMSALEARAAGLPVVARRGSGAGDVLGGGVEALLVEDDDDAARAVARLLVDADLHAELAGHNRTVPVAFTWDAALERLSRAYDAATGASPTRPLVPR